MNKTDKNKKHEEGIKQINKEMKQHGIIQESRKDFELEKGKISVITYNNI